ncbi:MAG: hypothetical protein JW834_02220 [Candidatus Diapherotrites archaeon]|nr:hypothetical protein [Candidatus Diapherotrites archaeon]
MRRAQTSFEFMAIVVIVMSVAVLSFRLYSTQGFLTSAEATVRSQADQRIHEAVLDFPECGQLFLSRIVMQRECVQGSAARCRTYSPHVTYDIQTSDSACASKVFTGGVLNDISSKAYVAMGCDYGSSICKGFTFVVVAS